MNDQRMQLYPTKSVVKLLVANKCILHSDHTVLIPYYKFPNSWIITINLPIVFIMTHVCSCAFYFWMLYKQ